MKEVTRRELLALLSAAPVLGYQDAPTAPVAIAQCRSYSEDLISILGTMFDQLGGLGRLVRNKTVTVKLNLTGAASERYQGRALGDTHYCHPNVVAAVAYLIAQAGARRIRLVESAFATAAPLEEFMLDAGWNVRSLRSVAENIEFENTNFLGAGSRYHRFAVPGGGSIFPAYDLNHSYEDTDVFVSLAKLKQHETCGVTLSIKNLFGITPAAIYGDDAGAAEPNESPGAGRYTVCHTGERAPSASAPQEIDPSSSRDPGYRMPRIVADLVAARPVHLAIIDGVLSMSGGEGPWISGARAIEPGLLIAGTNPVTTDAVATATMGFDPRARRGTPPFEHCDNTMLLAESLGVGTTDLARIEVLGLPIASARHPFTA